MEISQLCLMTCCLIQCWWLLKDCSRSYQTWNTRWVEQAIASAHFTDTPFKHWVSAFSSRQQLESSQRRTTTDLASCSSCRGSLVHTHRLAVWRACQGAASVSGLQAAPVLPNGCAAPRPAPLWCLPFMKLITRAWPRFLWGKWVVEIKIKIPVPLMRAIRVTTWCWTVS